MATKVVPLPKRRRMTVYSCCGPFELGYRNCHCVHGWNTPHGVSMIQSHWSNSLSSAGLLPYQVLEKAFCPDCHKLADDCECTDKEWY